MHEPFAWCATIIQRAKKTNPTESDAPYRLGREVLSADFLIEVPEVNSVSHA